MSDKDKIKVLIVEDSNVVRLSIAHLVDSDPGMQVIGMVKNGREALEFLTDARPDVILMDIEMPEMDGLEATRRIMETQPVPIILCSARLMRQDGKSTGQLLESGAVACVETPRGKHHEEREASCAQLLQTVRLMSEIKVVHRWPRRRIALANQIDLQSPPEPQGTISMIGIGASTGGPPVLKTILESLPKDFAVPILIVQHIARGFLGGLLDWLNHASAIQVHIAAQGDVPLPGNAYLAPDDFHMQLQRDKTIALCDDGPENGVRPSVGHLFRSLASACGPSAVGVLLTGMGKDSAQALKRMRDRGATTIAQDRASSIIHGMPGEAIAIGAASRVLSATEIAPALIELVNQQHCLQGGPSWSR